MLTPEENERYARQLALEDFGHRGQQRLRSGSVLVIGAGALGSPAIMYLAAAGVGRIGIADGDRLDLSNMQRQVIHATASVGRLKAESAAERALAINPNIRVEAIPRFLTPGNMEQEISGHDFVIDATDSLEAKFFINDACVRLGVPCCYGGVMRYAGQLMTMLPGSPCLRCLFPEMPEPDTAPRGPLGVVPGVIGALQAAEAMKYLARLGEPLAGRLLTFDALTMQFHTLRVPRRQGCQCAAVSSR